MRTAAALLVTAATLLPQAASAHPIGDPVPVELRGRWAESVAGCQDVDNPTRVILSADRIEFYEDAGNLLIGFKNDYAAQGTAPPDIGFFGRFLFVGWDRITHNDIELKRVGPDLEMSVVEEGRTALSRSDNPPPIQRLVRCSTSEASRF